MERGNKNYIIFFRRLIILFLLLIVIDISLGKLLEHFFFQMKTGQSARITYAITKADEDLIIFGSSRANHNYVPDIFEDSFHLSSYNAGVDGQSILYHYCILKNIKSRSKPKIIILDLNVDEFEKTELAYNKLYALLPYYYVCKNIQPIINLRSSYEPLKAFSNLYRYNSFILPVILNNIISRADDSRKGYLPLHKTLDSASGGLLPIVKNTELDTVKVNIFKSFLKEAILSNCKVFVFISPIYQRDKTISSTIITAEQICNEEKISFINYSGFSLFNEHPEYFQDVLHLNNYGAEIYTRIICSEIKNKIR